MITSKIAYRSDIAWRNCEQITDAAQRWLKTHPKRAASGSAT